MLEVEDNFCNVVPLRMLLWTGYKLKIDRAENGKEGTEMYEKNAKKTCCQTYYKLIFMDIHMPVMDGFVSTTAILKKYGEMKLQS